MVCSCPDWGNEKEVSINGFDEASILKTLESLIAEGATMPRSPESDVVLPAVVAEAGVAPGGENFTWDGKTIRVPGN